MKDNLEPEYLVDLIWHWKVEDNLDWKFCSGILLQDDGITISLTTLKNKFNKYFKDLTGVIPYTKCPKCGSQIIPREGKYSRFIACSSYPDCRYTAAPNNQEAKNEVEKVLIEFGRDSLTECPKCKGTLVVRGSIKGKFVGCSSYPECDFIVRPKRTRRTLEQIQKDKEELKSKLLDETGYAPYSPCPSCGRELVPREGRFGTFVGCSRYPKCNFIASSVKKQNEAIQELKETTGFEPGMDCPECGGKLKLCRGSSRCFIGCSNYPACGFIAESQETINARANFAEIGKANAENVKRLPKN